MPPHGRLPSPARGRREWLSLRGGPPEADRRSNPGFPAGRPALRWPRDCFVAPVRPGLLAILMGRGRTPDHESGDGEVRLRELILRPVRSDSRAAARAAPTQDEATPPRVHSALSGVGAGLVPALKEKVRGVRGTFEAMTCLTANWYDRRRSPTADSRRSGTTDQARGRARRTGGGEPRRPAMRGPPGRPCRAGAR